MTTELHDVTQFYHKIYYHDCTEFDEVRNLCLQEDNWLRHIYTKERLNISRHYGFAVIYDKRTDEPAMFAGVYRDERIHPSNVARMLNRTYTFPKYRSKSFKGVKDMWTIANKYAIEPLLEINNFDFYFIAIQDRKRTKTGYFDVWAKGLQTVNNNWNKGADLIQTCPHNVKNCWQHYVYLDLNSNWIPNTITYDNWKLLNEGTD